MYSNFFFFSFLFFPFPAVSCIFGLLLRRTQYALPEEITSNLFWEMLFARWAHKSWFCLEALSCQRVLSLWARGTGNKSSVKRDAVAVLVNVQSPEGS